MRGVYVPLVTPFDSSGRVDLPVLDAIVESMLAAGVHGIVACGTTGEGYALTLEERRAVLARICEVNAGRVPVIAGVGGSSTNEALDHAQLARALKVDGIMVAAPAYCLPTPSELARHVRAVVDAADRPTVLYDYPQRTGTSFTLDALDLLAADPRIVGIKEASGDAERVTLISDRYSHDLRVICGVDARAPLFLDTGVDCWIGGIANLLPAAHVAMMTHESRADAHAAVLPVLEFIESGNYISMIKSGMGLRGLTVGDPRLPLAPIDEESTVHLRTLLDAAGPWAPGLR